MKFKKTMALVYALVASPAMADSLDINLHNEALRATYAMQLEGTQGLSADFGLLYAEDENDNSENMVHAGLMVSGENWSTAGTFDVALGGRVMYTTPADADILALAFGGSLRFSPIPRLGIGGHIFYAPEITSLMDADSYQEIALRVDYQLMPQGYVYLGHRRINVEVDDVDWEFDDDVHVGFKMTF